MHKPMARSTKMPQRLALVFVLFSTSVAIVASALKAMDDTTFELLHTFSLIVMLGSYIVFIATVSAGRYDQVTATHVTQVGDAFALIPCEETQIIRITRRVAAEDTLRKDPALRHVARANRALIRGIVVRETVIDMEFLKLLCLFPNVVALDIQGCRVHPDVWTELAHFEALQLVLAHRSIDAHDLRDLSFVMPEIQVCIQPSQLIVDIREPLLPAA